MREVQLGARVVRTPVAAGRPKPIYWGKRKFLIAASRQVQVPGDRDLAYMKAGRDAAAHVLYAVRGPGPAAAWAPGSIYGEAS